MRNFIGDAPERKRLYPKNWFLSKLLGIWCIEPGLIRSKYFEWSKGWGLAFDFSKHRYSDDSDKSSMLHVQFIYGHWFIYLPLGLKVKNSYDTVEPPTYGFSWRWGDSLGGIHCHWNRKVKIIDMPWSTRTVEYQYLGVDGEWHRVGGMFLEGIGYQDWSEVQEYTEKHPYAHWSPGLRKLQEAEATVSRRRHILSWKWFAEHSSRRKTPVSDFLRRVIPGHRIVNSINVEFNREMGDRAENSWKGGTIGCGYDMKPGESIASCLRRMERERTFDR